MALEKVFVSYSRDDDAAVLKLVQDLRSAGVNVWLDQTDIPSGRRWDEAIEQALAACEQVIVVLSETSVSSQNVMDEVSYAIDEGKRVIPVIIRACRIPLRLRRMQYVDLTTEYDDRVEKLVATLTSGAGSTQTTAAPHEKDQSSVADPQHGTRRTLANRRRSLRRLYQIAGGIGAVLVVVAAYQLLGGKLERPTGVPTGLKTLEVWKVGSPHQGDTPDPTLPPDLQADARKLGFELAARGFPAQGFAAEFFRAFEKNIEPDILVIDNYGILEGITTDRGNFVGITSSQRVKEALVFVDGSLSAFESSQGGWQLLLTTSRNHAAAKSLALRRPDCQAEQKETRDRRNDLANEIQRDVRKHIVDSAMFDTKPGSDFNLSMCGLWGNRKLAFVNTAVVFEERARIGWQEVLVMMARSAESWELLNMGGNADLITDLDGRFDLVDGGQGPAMANEALRVLAPVDGVSTTRSSKPQLEWQFAGEPQQVMFYLLESQYGYRNEWSSSHFTLVAPPPSGNVSLGAPFGVGAQPHRWKVWAIGPAGAFTRTNWRIVNYTD